jgi:hypothetical protein
MAEIDEGLRPYVELHAPRDDHDASRIEELRALMGDITALDAVAQGSAEPPASARAEADSLVAAAEQLGQPGPIARARRVQSAMRQRNGDLRAAKRSRGRVR